MKTWLIIVLIIILFLAYWNFIFLRNPSREIPKGNIIVSPANGKIVKIIKFNSSVNVEKGFNTIKVLTSDVAKKGYLIVIVMNPLNVHYQKAPLDGTVKNIKYTKGKFVNAVLKAKSLKALENERNEILLDTKIGKIKVIQVAGFLARRIKSFVNVNDKVTKGQNIGLINFGSQTLLVLPELDLKVSEGQKVVDGETVIASY